MHGVDIVSIAPKKQKGTRTMPAENENDYNRLDLSEFDDLGSDELVDQIAVEMANWDKAGIATNGVNYNIHHIDCRLGMLEYLVLQLMLAIENNDEEVMKERMNLVLRKVTLKELRHLREVIEPEVRRQRLAASGVQLPTMAIPKTRLQ